MSPTAFVNVLLSYLNARFPDYFVLLLISCIKNAIFLQGVRLFFISKSCVDRCIVKLHIPVLDV